MMENEFSNTSKQTDERIPDVSQIQNEKNNNDIVSENIKNQVLSKELENLQINLNEANNKLKSQNVINMVGSFLVGFIVGGIFASLINFCFKNRRSSLKRTDLLNNATSAANKLLEPVPNNEAPEGNK